MGQEDLLSDPDGRVAWMIGESAGTREVSQRQTASLGKTSR